MYGVIFDSEKLKKQLLTLKNQSEDQNFWSDNDKAKKVMVEISELEQKLNLVERFENKISEVEDYYNMAFEEEDQIMISECYEILKKNNI